MNLTAGTWENYSAWSVNVGSSGLLDRPGRIQHGHRLCRCHQAGLPIHVSGTTLNVPSGMGFIGVGSINDPVVSQGTITCTVGGALNLNNGLAISGGSVNLANGNVTVNDTTISGLSGGSLAAANLYVGSGGTGLFAHSGGTNNLATALLSRL